MKVRILKDVVIPGHGLLKPGDVLDIAAELETFIRSGYAELAETVQVREPVIENRDPKLAKKPK